MKPLLVSGMSEKITISSNTKLLFDALCAAENLEMNFHDLRDAVGIGHSTFSSMITNLTSRNIIKKVSPKRAPPIRLLLDPNIEIKVNQSRVGATPKNSKPQPENLDRKKRGCLKCREKFVSEWPGERICKTCKSSTAWKEGHGLVEGAG